MPFWGGSGSGYSDPCFWLMDPDPDHAIFVIYLQHASKKLIFNTIFSAYYFLKVHLRVHHFSKIKSQKESQNIRNKGFSYYFCMMIEGSGSGSIPLTSGSGSWRPKNMWIRWIRNTARINKDESNNRAFSNSRNAGDSKDTTNSMNPSNSMNASSNSKPIISREPAIAERQNKGAWGREGMSAKGGTPATVVVPARTVMFAKVGETSNRQGGQQQQERK